ncbi:hypothetical protein TNIN_188631 [Trichonephila inaurata madagascariensis]|uniref:Uncharacterized protein n=1 Tax=Trichonephila inaurata madagascariensis TaxID=2747483 RepID=A0A8X6MGZ5_9ARAC|nr:hypothetical protein TNIN_188631 [Trichonephila inaurata madagascariensis]
MRGYYMLNGMSPQVVNKTSGTCPNPDFEVEDLNGPHRLNQAELSDLIRDLDLPKQKAELLASRLWQ